MYELSKCIGTNEVRESEPRKNVENFQSFAWSLISDIFVIEMNGFVINPCLNLLHSEAF